MTIAESYYVLDSEDRVTQISGALRDSDGWILGHSLWETSPHAQSLFGPRFEEARRTGREIEFTEFYAGKVARRRVVPSGDALTVFVTPIRELDVTTLATLAESLREIENGTAVRAYAQLDPRAGGSLRALP